MRVERLMTHDPVCCLADTPIEELARLMVELDCGAVPVVRSMQGLEPIGIVTDRDIVCRSIARGVNPLGMTARECMTSDVVTISKNATDSDCVARMERHGVRRIVITDERGSCCGIVSQADVVQQATPDTAAHFVQAMSRSRHLPAAPFPHA